MKTITLYLMLCAAGMAQITPAPACYQPIHKGELTYQCLYVPSPQWWLPLAYDQFWVYMSTIEQNPSPADYQFSATFSDPDGGLIRVHGIADNTILRGSLAAVVILYIPRGKPLKLQSLTITQDLGDIAQ